MSLTLVTPPAAEPVVLDRLKSRLRIADGDFDSRLTHLIKAARQRVEREAGLVCLSQTWVESRDSWCGDGRLSAFATRFRLLKPPLRAVERITFYAQDDTASEWDSTQYRVDTQSHPGRLILRGEARFPEPERRTGGIEIRFVCGFGETPEDVPAPLVQAIELFAADLFERGGEAGLSTAVRTLIAPWRKLSL